MVTLKVAIITLAGTALMGAVMSFNRPVVTTPAHNTATYGDVHIAVPAGMKASPDELIAQP
jgi:hypothetical protein